MAVVLAEQPLLTRTRGNDPVSILSDELTTDPLGRGYAAMTDAEAADDLNIAYRPGPALATAILEYIILERFRTGTLFGRMALVAWSRPAWDGTRFRIPPLPLGASDADVTIAQNHISSAASLLRYVEPDFTSEVLLSDVRFQNIFDDLDVAKGCEVMSAPQRTEIENLSLNQQTRGTELGIGHVREGDVTKARAL